METFNENNIINLRGVVSSEVEYSHEAFDEKYYRFFVDTKRLSDSNDTLPVIVSEKLININDIKIGDVVYINGQVRSHNQPVEDRKSKLILSIFTKEIRKESQEEDTSLNEVVFQGFICKDPIYRKTPLGREIADVLIAVNRAYKKSDYIPCILWGRNAKFCETLPVGSKVSITGRMQSRKYNKKNNDESLVELTAYEISASMFTLIRDEDKEEYVQA